MRTHFCVPIGNWIWWSDQDTGQRPRLTFVRHRPLRPQQPVNSKPNVGPCVYFCLYSMHMYWRNVRRWIEQANIGSLRAPKKSKNRERCVNICLYCMHMYWRNVRLLNNVQSSTRSWKPRLGRDGLKYVFIACICINEMFDVVSNKQSLAVKGSKKSKTPERRVNIYLYCTHMYWRNVRLLNNVQFSTRSSAIEGLKTKTRERWVNICLYCMHMYWRNVRLLNNVQSSTRSWKPRLGRDG